MSKLFIRIAAGLALTCGALVATQAVPAYPLSELPQSCDTIRLARVGELTYLTRQDAWVSKRGDLFKLAECPALKDRLIARG
ncbi:MAG: hypothetical protein ACHQAY_22135 [Hyphomicrobiales bacterium]